MSVYIISAPSLDLFKVGFATNVMQRFSSIRCHSPASLTLAAVIPGDTVNERQIHSAIKDRWSHGEWFYGCDVITSLISQFPAATQRLRRPNRRPRHEARSEDVADAYHKARHDWRPDIYPKDQAAA